MKNNRNLSSNDAFLEKQDWYKQLSLPGAKRIAQLIFKDHNYYSKQDRKYRIIVRILKLVLIFACCANTVVLGLKTQIEINHQVFIGLVISACTTLLTSIMSYFNYESYWMRNTSKHIRLNSLRDKFIFDAEANKLTEDSLEMYLAQLISIKDDNAKYWESKGHKKHEE